MCIGTLGALKQVNVKRFIAYTSVNQVGFIFLGISCCNLAGLVSSLIYLILYATMSLSFFAILLNLKHGATNRGIIYLSDLSSVSTYHTEGSKHLVISLVSMAGLPPTGGFISKFIVYTAATEAGLSGVILFVILFSVITAYVYLSVVRQIWFEKSKAFKLYFFDSNIYLICLLRLISLYLCCFILFLPATLKLVLVLSISCMFPFLCTNSVTYNSIGGVYYVIA
jgi:NADH:ubiquinone oxidoreductase subunit 2 (subunit N)